MIHPIYDIETNYFTESLNRALQVALDDATKFRSEFITPEHLLYAISYQAAFMSFCETADVDIDEMHNELFGYIISIDAVPDDEEYIPMLSTNLNEIIQRMQHFAISKTKEHIKDLGQTEITLFTEPGLYCLGFVLIIDNKNSKFVMYIVSCGICD